MASDENIFALNWSSLTSLVPRTSGGRALKPVAPVVAAAAAAESEARTEQATPMSIAPATYDGKEGYTPPPVVAAAAAASSSGAKSKDGPEEQPSSGSMYSSSYSESLSSSSSEAEHRPPAEAEPLERAKPVKRAEPAPITISSDEEPHGTPPPYKPMSMVKDEEEGFDPVVFPSSPEFETEVQMDKLKETAQPPVPIEPARPAAVAASANVAFGVEFTKKVEAVPVAAAAAAAPSAAARPPERKQVTKKDLLGREMISFKDIRELILTKDPDLADKLISDMLKLLHSRESNALKSVVLDKSSYKGVGAKYLQGNAHLLTIIAGNQPAKNDAHFDDIKDFVHRRSDYAPYEDLIVKWMTIPASGGGEKMVRDKQKLIEDLEAAQGKYVTRDKGASSVIEVASRAAVQRIRDAMDETLRNLDRPGANKKELEERLQELEKRLERETGKDSQTQQSIDQLQDRLESMKRRRSDQMSDARRAELEEIIASTERDLLNMRASIGARSIELRIQRKNDPGVITLPEREIMERYRLWVDPESARLLQGCDSVLNRLRPSERGIAMDFHRFIYGIPPYAPRYGSNFYDRLYNGIPGQNLSTALELIDEMLEFKGLPAPMQSYAIGFRNIIAPGGSLTVTIVDDAAEPQAAAPERPQMDLLQLDEMLGLADKEATAAVEAEEKLSDSESESYEEVVEDISDINVDEDVKEPDVVTQKDCPAVQLKPHMIREARDKMRMTSNVENIRVDVEYWLNHARTEIGPGRTLSRSKEAKLYIDAFAEQVVRMINQYIMYCPVYDTITARSFPEGLSLHGLVHRSVISFENQRFPRIPTYIQATLTKSIRTLSMGGAIYTGAGGYVPGCVVGCVGDSLGDAKGMVYTPRTTSSQGRTFGKHLHVMRPEDLQYPLCSWSPVPSLIETRNPHNLLRNRDYILPEIAIMMLNSNKKILWKLKSIKDRVLLIPNGANGENGCGYRMGRFVCCGLGDEDAYYAWMAEMGKFNGYYFYPLQNVTIYFTSLTGQSDAAQFARKERMNKHPMLTSVCGYVQVSCCVPGEGNEYESQVWLGAVSPSHIDGSLRTFLDGPDMEMSADCDSASVSDEFLSKAPAYSYFTTPNYKSNKRFRYGTMDMRELWSRTLTAVYTFDWIIKACAPVLDSEARGCNICPEEFVYTAGGFTISGGPSGMWGDEGRLYRRIGQVKIGWNRYMRRSLVYQYSALGIGGTCVAPLSISSCDYYMRCAGASGDFSNYPYEHTADPFVPYWALRPEFRAWADAQTARKKEYGIIIRRVVIYQQLLILLRYIALKMSLGMTYTPSRGAPQDNIYMAMAEMQFSIYDPAKYGDDARLKQLYEYCQARTDMCLFVAQRIQCMVLDAPVAMFGDALKFKCGALNESREMFNRLQHALVGPNTILNGIEGKGPVNDETFWRNLDKETTGHKGAVESWIKAILAFFDDRMSPPSEVNLIDRTPLK